ncbi:hypothetical protein PAXRUDRAFT_181457, partial [Paxillus rubicundulus Ve08.2h10]
LNWAAMVGNQLLAEQLAYDHGELQQMVDQDYPNLNEGQKRIYDEVLETVNGRHGHAPGGFSTLTHAYFVHGTGGCGKTHLFSLIAAGVWSAEKVVLCVASSGIASLLLCGGQTLIHSSRFPSQLMKTALAISKREVCITNCYKTLLS